MSEAVQDVSKKECSKPKLDLTMPSKPMNEERSEYSVNPRKSTVKRVESLGNMEELYEMLSAVKRRKTSLEFGIAPELTIRSDIDENERINLLEKDEKLRNSLSTDDGFVSLSSLISKAVIKAAEKVFLKNSEKFLFVEIFGNNMYLAVTWSTGKKQDPFVVKFFQYGRTYVPGDEIENSEIFNGIAIGIQEFINSSHIKQEFEEQGTIPIICCFSDYAYVRSPIERISRRVGYMSTFKSEIVGKNYCKEFAQTMQLIISKKKIEFTTVVPLHSGNFMSFYCFNTFDENKRPHANYDFLRGLSVQEFVDCPKVNNMNLAGTNLKKIYPESVLQGDGSKSLIIANSFFQIGRSEGFERNVIYKFLTKFERFNFDTNTQIGDDIFSQLASPRRQAIHLQNYIRNHRLYLINPKLEEEPVVNMERFDYFLQDKFKDHSSILHPYTFKLIGADINRFAKFVMKRCLSFSALALLATIDRKYYKEIEPKYKSGTTPKVLISIREDDKGLSNGFESSIIKYLDEGASIFWNQRRKDLESPRFEIISDFHSCISGCHILTKYLRSLIPHDYWVKNQSQADKEELEKRRISYKIALDAYLKVKKEEDNELKQMMANFPELDIFKGIDLINLCNTGDLKPTLEQNCGFSDMGEIEAFQVWRAPK
ncbi:MAG: hypothetical protein MHMPM18_005172 [Marteilia pararefringens]